MYIHIQSKAKQKACIVKVTDLAIFGRAGKSTDEVSAGFVPVGSVFPTHSHSLVPDICPLRIFITAYREDNSFHDLFKWH